ncbi:MAG: hypothetical protein JWN76_2162 [Chitinophagaceae bacterium]|nr:hypothetical protein [Chitinophagaceae bacterium]
MIKNLAGPLRYFLFVVLLAPFISCNNNSVETKTKKVLPYHLPAPKGWNVEHIPFPIEFAPQILYKGFEDLRFTPGWESTASEEHWSYAFFWWLEGDQKIDTSVLQQNLKLYYTGLVGRNVRERHIPANKLVPVITAIKKMDTANGDAETYTGTIVMLDYLDITFPAITLNCLIHKKACDEKNHTGLFFEISPRPFEHPVWQQLNKLNDEFRCGE